MSAASFWRAASAAWLAVWFLAGTSAAQAPPTGSAEASPMPPASAPRRDLPKIAVDSLLARDPVLGLPKERQVFSPKLKPLWLEALKRPESDIRREAAETIAKAHLRGMPGLEDTAEALMTLAGKESEPREVRLACARALVTLDARQSADLLFQLAQSQGLDMARIVSPALAQWRHDGARKAWLETISDSKAARSRLVLAIESLTTIGERSAAGRLGELATDRRESPDIRLAAAKAAGQIAAPPLLAEARQLIGEDYSGTVFDRLLGAELLARDESAEAEAILVRLAEDPEPAVAAVAWRRHLAINPDCVVGIAPQALRNNDANIRRLAAEVLVVRPTADRVGAMAPLLDDPHPDVRGYVRDALYTLSVENPQEFQPRAILGAMAALAAPSDERWRGHEQAALLLAALDHEPAASRLVELLEAPRPEVYITSAWALKKLAVPETYPAMLNRVERKTLENQTDNIGLQLEQIFEAFGQAKFAQAEPEMEKYVPKNVSLALSARVAAVWAIGHLHAGKPDARVAELLVGRLNDTAPPLPEMTPVRMMSAISLGRMQAKDQLDLLRRYLKQEGLGSFVGLGCAWAIHELTGEPIPQGPTPESGDSNWFLQPLDP